MAIKTRGSGGGGGTGTNAGAGATPILAEDAQWEDASAVFDQRTVIMDIYGPEGTGRSSLALTAPGPIAYINADEKIQGIVQPVVRAGKKVRVATFGFAATTDKQATLTGAEKVWAKTTGWMRESMDWAGTTILDTGTEAWELARMAHFGELNPKGSVVSNYGPVNGEMRGMFKQFRIRGANLITIHQSKDHYVNKIVNGKEIGVNTGIQKRAGFKEMGYIADVVIRTSKAIEQGDVVFRATIEKGWFNAALEGLTLEGADIRFAYIMSLITETEETEWTTKG